MKNIRLFFSSYRRNLLAMAVLIVVMAVSMFEAVYTIGRFSRYTYAKELYESASLKNAVYFMSGVDVKQDTDAIAARLQKEIEQIGSLAGVKYVLNAPGGPAAVYKGGPSSVVTYSQGMLHAFSLPLSQGTWFSAEPSDNTYRAVVGGNRFIDVQAGELIDVTLWDTARTQKEEIKVEVAGVMKFPAYFPNFGGSGTQVSADNFFQLADMMIFQEGDNLPSLLRNSEPFYSMNSFVVFEDSATEKQKNDCYLQLKEMGTYATYDEIIKNSDAVITDKTNKGMIFPVFMLSVSTICLICLSVLFIQKKLKEYSVYYLCGCSKKRCFSYMAGMSACIVFLAGIPSILYVAFYRYWSSIAPPGSEVFVFNDNTIGYILSYMLAVTLISLILPFLVYWRSSPIDMYRRNQS